jgi:hypothetical protein
MAKRLTYLTACAVLVLALTGCDTKGLVLGPYPFEFDVAAGVLDESLFDTDNAGLFLKQADPAEDNALLALLTPLVLNVPYAGMPTEEDFSSQLGVVLGAVGSNTTLEAIDLTQITVTASTGTFNTVRAVSLWYIPKPFLGVPGIPTELGTAVSLTGFGSEIVLKPIGNVDFLKLIRDNDANFFEGTPELQLMVWGTPPADTVVWTAKGLADVYVRLGSSKTVFKTSD